MRLSKCLKAQTGSSSKSARARAWRITFYTHSARQRLAPELQRVSEKLGKGDPVDLVMGALENARPKIEVKSRRVGGATYQVPVEIAFERQQTLAFRWMVASARKRKGVSMDEALADEIVDAYNNTGAVVKKKEETHRMAQANRAFAHLRW